MDTTTLLNKLIDRNDLSSKESSYLLEKIIAGELNPTQVAGILVALRSKRETVDEILGFIETMRRHMVKVNAPGALDIVGTGGDNSGTFNISTATSFVVAGGGVPIAKHGNRAVSSKCGSADVLEALGVNINLAPNQAENVFKKVGMVFLFAPLFHPVMKQIGPVRKELGLRTIFNFLGPFLNPASTKKQLLGVPNLEMAKKLAQVAIKLRFTHLMIITSVDGMDEITTTAKTKVLEVKGNKLNSYVISPKQFGIKKGMKKDLQGFDPSDNAAIILNILKGKKGPQREIVVLNSAATFYLAGKAKDMKVGISLAEKSIDQDLALKVLENLITATNVVKESKIYA
ncbi:anthranilate phosphoribosyltransferase [Candidatus Daviesbacteria bacterium]|nr:anthranilate phosphoribosyltransferase [Candidatus Daviesbacteria bacterium]